MASCHVDSGGCANVSDRQRTGRVNGKEAAQHTIKYTINHSRYRVGYRTTVLRW